MKLRLIKVVPLLTLVAVMGGLAGGCSWSIGEKEVESNTPSRAAAATRGQELIDLKKARDTGALTEDEYQAQKKKLMEK
jgi:hypothetical protein